MTFLIMWIEERKDKFVVCVLHGNRVYEKDCKDHREAKAQMTKISLSMVSYN